MASVAPVAPSAAEAAAPGRDAEFTAFVGAHGQRLWRVAWLLAGDHAGADDLLQESLARTYVAWNRARAGDQFAYARRVMANVRIDTWRRRRREVLTAPEWVPDAEARGQHQRADDRDQLVRALAVLTPKQRRIVVLRYYADLSEADVAHQLGISVGAVKSIGSRALATLRSRSTQPDQETR